LNKKSKLNPTRYILFQGKNTPPTLSQNKPSSLKKGMPIVLIEIEDSDILHFITGGLTGLQALGKKKIKILGDLELAQELESIFAKAGGVEKAMRFLKKAKL
jgi:hypothetical protein